jgi:OmpA-OmpF porin, OOP family
MYLVPDGEVSIAGFGSFLVGSAMERKPSPSRSLMRIGVIGLLITLAVAAWWGPNSARRLESRIEKAVQAALAKGGFSWAEAAASGQRIDLRGAAPSAESRDSAAKVAMAALGPGGILPGGVTKVTKRGVDVVRVESPFTWLALNERNGVSLEGFADSRATLASMDQVARQLFPNRMTSRLEIASGKPEGVNWAEGSRLGLQAVRRLEMGSARISDRVLTITGTVAEAKVIGDIDRLLEPARQGGFTVVLDLIPPAEWTASLQDKRLALSGKLPNESVRADLVRAASDAGVALDDKAEISGVQSPWGARAIAAMPNFLKLNSGEIAVQGNIFRISGEGPGSVQQFLREDMARLSDGMSVRYALREVAPEIAEISGVNLDATGAEKETSCQTAFQLVMQSNAILFSSGSAAISRQSGETLDKLVEVARRCSEFRISIEGHTDNVGQAASNSALSQSRANAVRAYLVDRGLAADQLASAGFGQERPVASNATPAGRAQNRRIEFKVSAPEGR